jgi:hypothetical protein
MSIENSVPVQVQMGGALRPLERVREPERIQDCFPPRALSPSFRRGAESARECVAAVDSCFPLRSHLRLAASQGG